MNNNLALLKTNLAVILFGLAGLFAKFIDLPAITITFGRVFFSSIALLIMAYCLKISLKPAKRQHLFFFIAAGGILAMHWCSFLYAIQISSVAIGTIAFSAFPLFVTLLEPLLFHEKWQMINIIFCIIISCGVFMMIPSFSITSQQFQGAIIGLFSALTYALLTLINRYFARYYHSVTISVYEQSSAAILLCPAVILIHDMPTISDIGALLFLGIITTAFAHTLFIASLKTVPAYLAGIISALEAVYSMIFAAILLHEIPSLKETAGAAIIVFTVIFSQFFHNHKIRR